MAEQQLDAEAVTELEQPDLDLIPTGDVDPDPYVEDPDYDPAMGLVNPDVYGDPHAPEGPA